MNKPRCPVMNYLRGGSMNIGAAGSSPNYWPNSLAGTPKPDPAAAESEWKIGKTLINRFDGCEDHDDYSLAGELFRSFDGAQRERLARRIARSLALARLEVQMRQLTNFFRADEEYCTRVAKNLGVDASAVIESGHREHALVNTH